MVSKTFIVVIITSNILMVLCGVLEEWLIMNLLKIPINIDAAVICMKVGNILGALMFALLAELKGRKFSLMALSIPFILSFCINEIFYSSIILLCFVGFFGGISVGGTFTVLPIYIGEISETNSRGRFISSGLTSYVIGLFIVGLVFKLTTVTGTILTVISVVSVITTIIFCITFGLIAPESPYYIINRGHHDQAKTTLDILRGLNTITEIELDEIEGKLEMNRQVIDENKKVMTCIKMPGWVKSGIMVFGLIISDFLINFTTSTAIFTLAATTLLIDNIIFILCAIQLISVCICPVLVDRIGRKLLLIISYGGMAGSLILLTILNNVPNQSYINPIVIAIPGILSNICLLIGLAPLQLILIAELFSMKTKMIASALFNSALFGFRLLMYTVFIIHDTMGLVLSLCMIFFAIFMIIVVKKFYVETNHKSLNQIQLIINKTN